MKSEHIAESLLSLLNDLKPLLDAERHQMALQVTRQGQPGAAFQAICSNLLHQGETIPSGVYTQIKTIGQSLSFPEYSWTELERLTTK